MEHYNYLQKDVLFRMAKLKQISKLIPVSLFLSLSLYSFHKNFFCLKKGFPSIVTRFDSNNDVVVIVCTYLGMMWCNPLSIHLSLSLSIINVRISRLQANKYFDTISCHRFPVVKSATFYPFRLSCFWYGPSLASFSFILVLFKH